jgi:hypothetical protein
MDGGWVMGKGKEDMSMPCISHHTRGSWDNFQMGEWMYCDGGVWGKESKETSHMTLDKCGNDCGEG